jgi:predicted DNA-binding transcriptional regulator AlpA
MANKRLPASFRCDLTIPEFCKKHRMGRSSYYDLQKRGLGPKVIRIGNSVRITRKADDKWIEQTESQVTGTVPKFAPKHQARGKEDDGTDKAPKRKRHSEKHRTGSRKQNHHAHYW